MFWKKKKNNEIIFWYNLKGVQDIVPIREAKYFIPEWFKKAPSFPVGANKLTAMPTVKRCPGFIDYYKVGYVLPAWCDFYLEISEEEIKVETPNNAFKTFAHADCQFKDYLPKHAQKDIKLVFKPACPWNVKTPKGVKMLELPMLHHYNPDFYTVGGLFDSYLFHEMNPQWIFTKTGKFLIERGTPLSMFIPIRAEEFDVTIREQNKEDAKAIGKQIYSLTSTFTSKFRKYEKIESNKEKDIVDLT